MLSMVVTLDVSKSSGWLNASAFCRRKEGDIVRGEERGEVRAGSLEGGGVQWRKQRAGHGPNSWWGEGHAWSARRTCSPWS